MKSWDLRTRQLLELIVKPVEWETKYVLAGDLAEHVNLIHKEKAPPDPRAQKGDFNFYIATPRVGHSECEKSNN